jgi:Zinc finger, C3HC4 type (RING finger)
MNRLFQVTVYTGQQLVLEALQRWLQRPCTEPDVQRQRRASIKNLIVLLLKTAATGVLATILDAAIEYRRRQLLAAAEEDPLTLDDGSGSSSSSGTLSQLASSRFGLGPLSRAGIAAWKTRLLIAIDEMERQAHTYGIEPTMRFTPPAPGKLHEDGSTNFIEDAGTASAVPEGKLESATAAVAAAIGDNDTDDRQAALAATVEQLQQLAKLGGDDAERNFEERVDSLLDSLLGTTTNTTDLTTCGLPTPISNRLKASPSTHRLTTSASELVLDSPASGKSQTTSENGGNCSDQICHICMDRAVGVQVLGCHHDLCFQCARRLCAGQDHALPQCPFCRQPINGFSSYTPTAHMSTTTSAPAATALALASV